MAPDVLHTSVPRIICSVVPIKQFAYMPIFHSLYADPIRYCLCEIYGCIYLLFTHGIVLTILLFVCYTFNPKYIVHVVTGILSIGCTHLQIVLVQFDNNLICKVSKILRKLYRQCIGNAVAYNDTLPISSI